MFLFQINFLLGYLALPMQTFQTFIPCLLATLLINEGEKYYENLCNVPWYLMEEPEKKSMLILLGSAIEPKSMACGLSVMNLQLFVDVGLK